jgi:hypothetical protein
MAAPPPRSEPSTAPSPLRPPRREEPPTAPAGTRPPKPKREPASAATATKEPQQGGIPSWVWIAIILVVGVAAYFLGQGR